MDNPPALEAAWKRLADALNDIPGGMHADLEDAACAFEEAFAARNTRPSSPLPANVVEAYASQAEAWNDALEKAAQIVERYNAVFTDPEAGGAPDDIRALKRNSPQPSLPDAALVERVRVLTEALRAVRSRGLPDRYSSDAELTRQVDEALALGGSNAS